MYLNRSEQQRYPWVALSTLLIAGFFVSASLNGAAEKQLLVTVRDALGNPIRNLQPADFVLDIGGIRQTITSVSQDEKAPASLGILVDTSASMKDKLPAISRLVSVVVRLTRTQDEIMLMTFGDSATVRQAFTSDRARLEERVRGLRAEGGSDLSGSVVGALKRIVNERDGQRALLVISDLERKIHVDIDSLRSGMKRYPIPIYTLATEVFPRPAPLPQLNMCPPQPLLPLKTRCVPSVEQTKYILSESGGRSLSIDLNNLLSDGTLNELSAFIQAITKEFQGSYVIRYAPQGPTSEKSEQTSVRVRDYEVRTIEAGRK